MERDKRIDTIKGIGIILMVLGHCGFPGTSYIYCFHMSLFFIVSGFLFDGRKYNSVNSVGHYLIKKIKAFWIPFFLFNSVNILFNNIYLKWHFYASEVEQNRLIEAVAYHEVMTVAEIILNIVKCALWGSVSEFGSATWFLRTLFFVSVLYCIINYALGKMKINKYIGQGIVSIVFLFTGYMLWKNSITLLGVANVFSIYILLFLGERIHKYKKIELAKIGQISTVFCCFIIIFVASERGDRRIDLNINSIVHPIYYVFISLAGFFMIWYMATLIHCCPKMESFLCYLGERTIWIMLFHLVGFKFVTMLQIVYYDYDIANLAAFPVLIETFPWWGVYMIVGIGFPILIEFLYRKLFRIQCKY